MTTCPSGCGREWTKIRGATGARVECHHCWSSRVGREPLDLTTTTENVEARSSRTPGTVGPAQQAILRTLEAAGEPLTGPELARLLPGWTPGGVDNAVRALARAGLVDRLEAGSGVTYCLGAEAAE